MSLVTVLAEVAAVVLAMYVLALPTVLGREALAGARGAVRSNVRAVAPTLVLLGAVLAVNSVLRDVGVELSWLIGVNVTGDIYAVEGRLVAWIQSVSTPFLTDYFTVVYVFGYAFLLTFPVLAYLLVDDSRPLRTLLVAYALNYCLGLVCYVLFVAYGPRNFMPELVEPLLYTNWPQSQLLTGSVNRNTNVFPSLHTSLSVTVALVAYRFRAVYPRWPVVAGVLAASITVSTMYLGIHWATDIVGGVLLAALAVAVAARAVEEAPRNLRANGSALLGRWHETASRWFRE